MQEQDRGIYRQLTKLDNNIRRLKMEVQIEQQRKALFEEEFDSDSESETEVEVKSCNISPKQIFNKDDEQVDFNQNTIITPDPSRRSSPGNWSQDSGVSTDEAADHESESADRCPDTKSKGNSCDENLSITTQDMSFTTQDKANTTTNKIRIHVKSHRKSLSEGGSIHLSKQPGSEAKHIRSKTHDSSGNGNIPSCIKKRRVSCPDSAVRMAKHVSPVPSVTGKMITRVGSCSPSLQAKVFDLGYISENEENVPSGPVMKHKQVSEPKQVFPLAQIIENTEQRKDLKRENNVDIGTVSFRSHSFSTPRVGLKSEMLTTNYGNQPQGNPPASSTNLRNDTPFVRTSSLSQLDLTGAIFRASTRSKRDPALARSGSMGRIVFAQNGLHSAKVTKEIYDGRQSLRERREMNKNYHQPSLCRMSSNSSVGDNSLSPVSSFTMSPIGRTSSVVSLV